MFFLKRFPVCFNLFVLLFLITILLGLTVKGLTKDWLHYVHIPGSFPKFMKLVLSRTPQTVVFDKHCFCFHLKTISFSRGHVIGVLSQTSKTFSTISICLLCYIVRGGSRTAATSKMERFVMEVTASSRQLSLQSAPSWMLQQS